MAGHWAVESARPVNPRPSGSPKPKAISARNCKFERRVRCEPDFLSRVDHAGEVLDVLVQRRRDDSRAALRLMRKFLKEQGFAPRLLVTDSLRSIRLGVQASAADLPT